ncbi:MAG: DUF3515 family protein [Longispora sp.]|nr:DUF3515 family protein [Longispora sp. (in: high G+C Gram-positive bacteria)]
MTDLDRQAAARLATLIAVPMALIVGIAAVWFLTSASATSTSPAPALASASAAPPSPPPAVDLTACHRMTDALPGAIRGLAKDPASAPGTASYGTSTPGVPAVTVSCGGAATTFPPMGMLWALGGVCWYGEQHPGSVTFSTVDRVTPVRVNIPVAYEGQVIAEFSSTLATQPARTDIPVACR